MNLTLLESPFPFLCRKAAEVLSTWLYTDLDEGLVPLQPGLGAEHPSGPAAHAAGLRFGIRLCLNPGALWSCFVPDCSSHRQVPEEGAHAATFHPPASQPAVVQLQMCFCWLPSCGTAASTD